MLCSLLSIAEETLTEFLAKATGTAVDWIQLPGMKVCFCFVSSSLCLSYSVEGKVFIFIHKSSQKRIHKNCSWRGGWHKAASVPGNLA
jgi:hypothetical protein